MKKNGFDVDDLILNYDPEFPQARFLSAGIAAAFKSSTGRLPSVVPWPEASKPIAAPLERPPAGSDDLSKFHGYDAVVVTWTAAEAAALAALLTPDYLPSRWYEYRPGTITAWGSIFRAGSGRLACRSSNPGCTSTLTCRQLRCGS
jgi:hypothetical protein